MDWHIVALAGHLIGFALGAGGATISDITFLNAIRERKLSAEQHRFLMMISKVVWLGFILLVISGAAMFALIYIENHSLPMLAAARWQAKLTLVGIVLINGIYFKVKVFPALKNMVGQELNHKSIGVSLWRLAVPGTISILSWYSILVLSILPRGLNIPLGYFIFIYAVLLICGIIISKTLLKKLLGNYSLSLHN
ncbi:hypothetical protein IPM19_03895 [bacterium]|nr:MAG: hypothetical protein IPM19_03895 [bacterium]